MDVPASIYAHPEPERFQGIPNSDAKKEFWPSERWHCCVSLPTLHLQKARRASMIRELFRIPVKLPLRMEIQRRARKRLDNKFQILSL